ncbi:MAG: helix-turn-helix domain-containing protein [Gemmataceae bacterium]|nr:helix-turn-helix domain-containing protein [Gemmataceae bacterium]
MNAERRKALEARGYKVYDHAGDAVGMTEDEKQEMDFRIFLSRAIRKRRNELGLSPKDLAVRLKVSESRAAKIEFGNYDVPLEQVLHAYSALGGRLAFTELPPHSSNGVPKGTKAAKKKARAT